MHIIDLILNRLLPACERSHANCFCAMVCLIILSVCPLCGCSATVGRTQGDPGAAFLPCWDQVRQAAVKAARSTGVWVSTASTRQALAGDASAQQSGRTTVETPRYGAQTSAGNVTNTAKPVHEDGAASYPHGTINVMASAPAGGPDDAREYDSLNALANAAAGHFVGALIAHAFLDRDRDRQGVMPEVKASKDGVLVSFNWAF